MFMLKILFYTRHVYVHVKWIHLDLLLAFKFVWFNLFSFIDMKNSPHLNMNICYLRLVHPVDNEVGESIRKRQVYNTPLFFDKNIVPNKNKYVLLSLSA